MALANLANWALPPDQDNDKKSGCDCGGKKNPGSCASACGCKDGKKSDKSASCGASGSCAAKKTADSDKKGPCSPGSCAAGSCAGAPKKTESDQKK